MASLDVPAPAAAVGGAGTAAALNVPALPRKPDAPEGAATAAEDDDVLGDARAAVVIHIGGGGLRVRWSWTGGDAPRRARPLPKAGYARVTGAAFAAAFANPTHLEALLLAEVSASGST